MNCIEDLFRDSKHLDKKLILGKSESITYRQMYTMITQVASMIQSKGAKKGEKVVVLANNSIFFIAAYCGTILAGNVCVPLDTRTTPEKLQKTLQETSTSIIFVEETLQRKVPDKLKHITYTQQDISEHNSTMYTKPIINEKEDVAVILFTSGSEGKRKGVMLTHQNIIANTNSIIEYLSLTKKDIMETVLPFYYCYGTSLLHTHIKVGGSLVLNNKFMFPGTVIEDINNYNCTGFAGVPSTFQILLKRAGFGDIPLPSLRYMTQAGGKLPETFLKQLREKLPRTELIVMYGQTEATARLSYLPSTHLETKLNSIGKGIPGVTLRVVDKLGNDVATGEVGEIVASGDNIMKGYFNDPEATSRVLEKGILKTGDLGTIDEEGYIYVIAREKHLIKSGGNRVSPKEIENILVQSPHIIAAAVTGKQDDILGEAIIAYVVLKKRDELMEEDVKSLCREHLECYKIPRQVIFVEKLPMNSYGKVMVHELGLEKNHFFNSQLDTKSRTPKVMVILGTRPEIIKLSPLVPYLEKESNVVLVHTGQHYSYNMDKLFFKEINMQLPHYTLNVGSASHGAQTGKMMEGIENIALSEKPDAIVVQGDTNTTLAGALVASKLHITLAHIESGSRSFNRTMPEEINRVLTDQVSDILFANDEICQENLLKEGISTEKIHLVGNTALDAVRSNIGRAQEELIAPFNLTKEGYVLLTCHRAGTTDNKDHLINIVDALNVISERIPIIFPIHPRTKNAIERFGLQFSERIKVIEPQGFLTLLALLKYSLFVMTDSGGVQRESVELNVPCLVLRDRTEAEDINKAGKTILTTRKKEKIVEIAMRLLDDKSEIMNIKQRHYPAKSGVAASISSILMDKIRSESK